MSEPYDLVVIGTGAAASTAAFRCNADGWDVAVVDSRPYGGTCALRGCDPKKVLVGAADALDGAKRMHGNGLSSSELEIHWPELMAFKRTFTRPVPEDREQAFHEAGIDTFHGRAQFTGEASLEVDGEPVEAEHVLVASGAKPRPLDIPGTEHITHSAGFLELDDLPDRVVFIGGGYISFEFAHVAARAGAEASVLHRSERVLKAFDPDLVDRLVDATEEAGITLRTNAPVSAVDRDGGELLVHTDDGDPVACDLVVHGAGRIPEIEDLDLDAAGVEHDRSGVTVDEHLRSVSNPAVYAAGDAAATEGWPLTPVASAEGRAAASNMLDGGERTVDYRGTASVVFAIPPLARVGLTEQEAREEGVEVEVQRGEMSDWFSYRRVAAEPAAYKILVEVGTDRIVGAHLLGERAEGTINLFALAVRQAIPASELRRMPWTYPTHASDVPHMV